jgi:hypothetical protein
VVGVYNFYGNFTMHDGEVLGNRYGVFTSGNFTLFDG